MQRINVIHMKYQNMINMNHFLNEKINNSEDGMREVLFNFQQLKWIDPSGAIVFLETIENLKEKGISVQFEPLKDIWKSAISYGLTMGIFQKIGISTESSNDEGNTYLAPKKIYRSEVYEFIEEQSKQIEFYYDYLSEKIVEKVLRYNIKKYDEKLKELFIYVVREIIRNIFDHSSSEYFYYGSQYIPMTNEVELVIADRGIGLRNTVPFDVEEIWLSKDTTEAAIMKAFTAGVTAGSNHGYAPADYMNSGFGLAMVKNIILEAGGILSLATSDKSVTFIKNTPQMKDCNISGTLIRIRVSLDRLALVNFEEQLQIAIKEAKSSGVSSGPSRRSTTLENLT